MSRDFSRRSDANTERWLRWDWRNLSLPRLRVACWDDREIAVWFDVSYEGGDDAFSIGASFVAPDWLAERVYRWEHRASSPRPTNGVNDGE